MKKLKLLIAAFAWFGAMTAGAQVIIETDLTSQFNSLATTQWTYSSGPVTWAAPQVTTNSGLKVAAWERYNGSCDWTGDIMYSTVTGLPAGTYKIELYGAAAFTFDRGFGSTAFTGDFSVDKSTNYKENDHIDENTGVTLYATTSEGTVSQEIPIYYATNFNTSGLATATLNNVVVGSTGEIKIGLSKTSTSTNWHVVQLKGVTATIDAVAVFAEYKAEADELLTHKMNASVYSDLYSAANVDLSAAGANEYKTAIETLSNKLVDARASVPNYARIKEVIDYNAAKVATYDTDGQNAYATASAEAIAAYDDGTATDGNTEIAALKAALISACKAQTQPADGCDMSPWIVNAGIDGYVDDNTMPTGWTIEKNGNGGYAGGPWKPTHDAMEFWGASTLDEHAAGKTFDYYQTITGLPNGIYTIGADLLNSTNGEEGANWNGGGKAGVYGQTECAEAIALVTTDGEAFTPYTTGNIVVYDGTLRIGVKNIAALTGRWFACDNFKLTYVRQLEAEDFATISSVKLAGSFTDWQNNPSVMDKVDETNGYSCEIDLSETTEDAAFKLIINDNWMDYSAFTMDESNPTGWLEDDVNNNHNIILKNTNTGYKTYVITATWTPCPDATKEWTLKIEGKDLRNDITKVEFAYGIAGQDWSYPELTTDGDKLTYTGELDLTSVTDNQQFKLRINGDIWLGDGQITIDAPDGFIGTPVDGNITLNHASSHFLTYNLTATWVSNADLSKNWTLKIEGKDPVVATIEAVKFSYGKTGESEWGNVELSKSADNTYTGKLDLTGIDENKQFGVVINNEFRSQGEITIVAPDGWITPGASTHTDITLNHVNTGYLSYTLTATWEPSWDALAGWTLTIEGDEAAPVNTYTAKFVLGWGEWVENNEIIYAYAWDNNGNLTDAWPGTPMTLTEEKVYGFPVYSISFDTYRTPTKIQFNNGSDAHQKEFDFENGKSYEGVIYETFTVGAKGWATAITHNAVDFTDAEGVEAYTATVSNSEVTLHKQGAVLEGTALVLKGVVGNTTSVDIHSVASADEVDNELYWYSEYLNVDDTQRIIYGLTADNEGNAKFAKVANGTTFYNKAVLQFDVTSNPNPARELSIVFAGDEANGIDAIVAEKNIEGIYNMNGQRVAAPAKGLYIVNGKKVIMK